MKKNSNLHVEEHTVKFLEVDGSGLATVKSLCNYLQEAAYNSSRSLGTSIDNMQGDHVTWVYSRYLADVVRYPRVFETVSVATWRSHYEGSTAFREFLVRGSDGGVMARATVEVVLINVDTRKPSAIPGSMKDQFAPELGSAAERVEKIPELENASTEMEFRIRSSDLDINGHVNNAAYIEFITECAPRDFILSMRPSVIEINFLAEVVYGQKLVSQSADTGGPDGSGYPCLLHRLIRSEDGRTVTRGRTAWRAFD